MKVQDPRKGVEIRTRLAVEIDKMHMLVTSPDQALSIGKRTGREKNYCRGKFEREERVGKTSKRTIRKEEGNRDGKKTTKH